MKRYALIAYVLFFFGGMLHGQDVSFETSTLHDENIFDIYDPTSDQITQFQLNVSKDWDFDDASLGIIYDGSGFLFHDITPRNYQIHLASLSAMYHFPPSSANDDDDSTGSDSISQQHSDSLDHFLSSTILAGGQFDRQEFQEYDNSIVEGSVNFRQPIGLNASARPIYTLSYHQYPNLNGLTNIQNIFSLMMGTDVLSHSWIAVAPAFGIKSYPTSSIYYFTTTIHLPSGHGKGLGKGNAGGNTVTKTHSVALNTPSVRQFTLGFDWNQTFFNSTVLKTEYMYFGNPSTEARVIPDQVRGAIESRGLIGEFSAANEIFDDHYGYSGNQLTLTLKQPLPVGFAVEFDGRFAHKTYTVPAMDLNDSLQVAPNRIDDRSEAAINLSKTFSFGSKQLKPEIEIHYLRNSSNAPFYDFDKTAYLAGVEFSF